MKLFCLLVALWCVLPFISQAAPKPVEPPPVELIADAPFLQPTSTLEFRFARPMIARDEIGLTPKQSPVIIAPAVPGTFTWLSRSSGVFVPAGAWPLGGQFVVTLSPVLKAADGKPLAGAFRAMLKAPPFARTAMRGDGEADEARPFPKVMLAFNLAIDLTKAEEFFQFVDSGGRKVAAKLRYGTRGDYFSLKPEDEDWEERWRLAKQGPKAELVDAEDEEMASDDAADAPPLPNRVVITPANVLTPGGVWRLEMKRGLKSKTGLKITEPFVVPLGPVRAFAITTLQPANYINSGRNVMLEFSHALAPDITPDTAAKFFRIEPPVPNLHFDGWSSSLTIHGDFELGREYRLEVDAAVISEDGLPFEGHRRSTFRFAPVAPRLYLPAITGHQVRSGQRKFEALSANLQSIKVTAQVVAGEDAAASLKAFEKYRVDGGDSEEQYQPLPPGLIRGKTIFERTIELPAGAIDARQQTALDWSEILGAQKAGVIFLMLEGQPAAGVVGKKPGAQALIQLTDIGVLWKKVVDGLRVTAFSMATGRPLEGANVALLNAKFETAGRGTTDAEGTTTLPIVPELSWVVVTHGEDVHAFGIATEGGELPMSAFRVPLDYSSWVQEPVKSLALRALIFTDRPLYRPGETVHVKGIVRDTAGSALAPRGGLEGTLKMLDPRFREISETKVRTDERGAFDVDLELNAAGTGGYTLTLEFPQAPGSQYQRGFRCKFEVADFQPNAFELNLPLATRLAPGTDVSTKVTAKYLFGAPLTKADGRWTLRYMRDTFAPEGFEGWHFGEEENGEGKILTLHGEGAFGGADGFSIEPQLPAVKDAPYKGVLTVEVTDINQQTVSESRLFMRDAADFYLGLAVPEGNVLRPGDEIVGRAVAIQPDGQPVAQPVEVSAELILVRFETVRVQGAGKAVSFRSEKVEEVVGRATGRTLLPIRVNEGWEVRDGVTATFKAPKAGQYRLRMTAKDAGGRAVTSELPVFVSGAGEVAWDYRNPAQIDLVADKTEYRPGDTARLLVKTPISGEALVTVERDERILRTMRVKLEGNAPAIEIPLDKADAPNVFVSMVLIRGREQSTRKFKTPEYRYGLAMLRVSDPVQRLQIEVAPARVTVEPGQEVETEVSVRDGAGAAVADAEVTFFAVDDGILALTGYERPAPQPIFDAPFSLAIRTGLTLFDLLPEDPTDLEFSNKGYLIGGGGLDGPGLKLRRDFPGTACWFPSLKTDAVGKVRVRFPAPDAITRYRLVAVAHAGAHLFGSAESAFAIRKPLMLLSALGQFANVGDELIARAVVRNDTGADAVADVALQLDNTAEPAKPGAEATKVRVAVKNGEARAVDLPVRLTAMGKAEWSWSAKIEAGGRTFEDHVLAALTVGSSSPVLRETYVTELGAPSSDLLAGVNPQLLDGTGAVAVTLANTRLAELRESANRLLEYPYGCAEQTVSSLIPWALLPELRAVMPDLAKNEDQANTAISNGLERLFNMQTGGGGLSYWPGGTYPSVFASAYGALACSILAKQGVDLPAGHEALLKYLSEELRGAGKIREEQALADRVLAVYALAASERAEPAYHEELFRRRKELSYESRALLALAILEVDGSKAMVDDLLSFKTATPDTFSWFGGAARERAVQLLAWSRYKPKSAEVGRLTKELLGFRMNGHWGTTQQNAWALLALARYYAASEDGGKPVKGALVRRGGDLPFEVTKEKPSVTETMAFAPTQPLAAMSVSNPAKGTLFGETRFVVRPPAAAQPRQDRGYAVSRTYRKLADDGSLVEAGDLKVGDRILVTLRVETTRPGHFVAIDDPLPAIFQAVNPAFQSQQVGGADATTREWASDYREMRADRVIYFCDHLPAGAFTFRYLARVRAAGSATAGPTKVEEMYRPERFGLGESTALTSRLSETK
jgi:uncharacterized protein YfaS (alpha-2-macroglobulin family)